MGASWLEVDTLIRETEKLFEFPHAEALPLVARARDMVAETAMVVSLAGVSGDQEAETEAQILLARTRVALLEAQVAIRRAAEAAASCRAGRDRALQLMAEARALRARDQSWAMRVQRAVVPAPRPVTALVRIRSTAS
jgi:hypothetical protein